MGTEVITFNLEMNSPGELRRSDPWPDGFVVRQSSLPSPAVSRFLYATVGAGWQWVDRLEWTDAQWLDWLGRNEVQTWIGYSHGTPAGYFELELQPDNAVEIAYFGLLPQFFGKRLGGALLTRAVECAWAMGPARVWVHTCSLDHPSALANYRARGFRIFREDRTPR